MTIFTLLFFRFVYQSPNLQFVKRIKASNGQDDEMSVSSTGTMQSIRQYFAERKAKKEAKRAARQQHNTHDDDDLSSVSSMSSVRKFFRRKKKTSTNNLQRTPTKSINVPNNAHPVSPLKGMFSPELAIAKNQPMTTPARDDDDDDNGSVSSLNALSGRKSRKSTSRKKKKSTSPPLVAPTLAPDAATPKLLQPLDHNDEQEPDLIKDVPTYDSYLDEMEHNKVANGKASSSYETTSRQLVYLDQPAEAEHTGLCADGCTAAFWAKLNPFMMQRHQQ